MQCEGFDLLGPPIINQIEPPEEMGKIVNEYALGSKSF